MGVSRPFEKQQARVSPSNLAQPRTQLARVFLVAQTVRQIATRSLLNVLLALVTESRTNNSRRCSTSDARTGCVTTRTERFCSFTRA